MTDMNPEGMTWEEWLHAAFLGEVNAEGSFRRLSDITRARLKKDWREGVDPTDIAANKEALMRRG